jgi:hypothetical protein
MKYIYFEISQIVGAGATEKEVQNINILLLKPHTNSNGVWFYKNMTERYRVDGDKSHRVIEQVWVDLEKYDMNKQLEPDRYFNYIDIFIKKVYNQLSRDIKINSLLLDC